MDLNEDGHIDLLSGSYSRTEESMAGLFQVLWGQSDGTFQKATPLTGTDGEPLIIPIAGREQQTENICTRPYAVDWDGDEDLDLVVGNFSGTFYLFQGEGAGKFAPQPEPLEADGSQLKIAGAHSDPFVIDWDGDGDLDLLSGSSNGGVQWAENRAGKGKPPELRPFRSLIAAHDNRQILRGEDVKSPGRSTRVWADDVNSDGKLDILVGDSVRLISPAEGVSMEEYKKRQTEWQEAVAEISRALTNAKTDEERNKANDRFRELYNERRKFMHEDHTGFVWLYLQK